MPHFINRKSQFFDQSHWDEWRIQLGYYRPQCAHCSEMLCVHSPKGTSKKKSLKEYEVTIYKDFRDRSVVGDNLEGHELWQHANLKANGLATTRLSTDVSKNNPVIVLTNKQHKFINNAQRNIDAANQSPLENIMSNSKILRDAGIPEDIVKDITEKTLNHMKNTIKKE